MLIRQCAAMQLILEVTDKTLLLSLSLLLLLLLFQISDGAEIIKISKRFFLSHAQNNTMLKVETMVCYQIISY